MGAKNSKPPPPPTLSEDSVPESDEDSVPESGENGVPESGENGVPESGEDGDNEEGDYFVIDFDDDADEHASHRSSHSHSHSHHQTHPHRHTHRRRGNGPLRRSKSIKDDDNDEDTSFVSTYDKQETNDDWLLDDVMYDHSCSDTDCSWASDDSDYSSMFSLYEEEMKPTKWMRRFQEWLEGGDIDISKETQNNDEEKGNNDDEKMKQLTSKYAVFETPNKGELLQLKEEPEEEGKEEQHKEEVDDNNDMAPEEDTNTGNNDGPEDDDLPAAFNQPFTKAATRAMKLKLLPILDMAETMNTEMDVGDSLKLEPGEIPWEDVDPVAQQAWIRFGWNEENWNVVIEEKRMIEVEKQRNKDIRKTERKFRRQFRKERRKARKKRRKVRDRRAERNRRGGGKKWNEEREEEEAKDFVDSNSSSDEEIEVREDGMRVEELIRRIMKRAEKEDILRREKNEIENAKKRKARQEAIGMLAVEDSDIQVKDMSLDMELRTRPWNSRAFGDRTELLYQTLYRPFTKNV